MRVSRPFVRYIRSHVDFGDAGSVVHKGLIESLTTKKDKRSALVQARRTEKLLNRSLFNFAVDSFQTYLSEILEDILRCEPRILAGKQFRALDAFSVPDLATLQDQLIDRFVIDLGYKSIDDLEEFFSKALKVELIGSKFGRLRLKYTQQIRNLHTHNRGIVNSLLLFKTGHKRLQTGSAIKCPDPLSTNNFLTRVATQIDASVMGKYVLETGSQADLEDAYWLAKDREENA